MKKSAIINNSDAKDIQIENTMDNERNETSKPTELNSGQNITGLSPFGINTSAEKVYDCMAFLIHCTQHKKIAVSKIDKSRAVWLPFVVIPPNKTWKEVYSEGSFLILSKGEEDSAKNAIPAKHFDYLQLLRIQLPDTKKSVIRLTCYVKLDQTSWKCCENTRTIDWVLIDDVRNNKVINLWGPEVCEFVNKIKTNQSIGIQEYGISDALFYNPSDRPKNLEEAMLKSASIHVNDILRLYGAYVEHCFPSVFMSELSFMVYIKRLDNKINYYSGLFNAFAYNGKEYLNFHDIVLGLASLDPSSIHTQLRVKFVFRFYDNDCDGYLNNSELLNMVIDINGREKQMTENDMNMKVSEALKTIGMTSNRGVSLDQFCKAVGELKFRGTSNLCRSPDPVFPQLSCFSSSVTSFGIGLSHNEYKGICMACDQKSYEYACHIVRLSSHGNCMDATKMFEPNLDSDKHDTKGYRYSVENVFNPQSIANVMIDMIRDFNDRKGTCRQPNGFMSAPNDRQELAKHLQYLCDCVKQIVSSEQRVIKVNSPCFIIGDIHGNLEDLLSIEKLLWQSVPILSSNYLFLGDYVDRGRWGVECVIYLFTLKILAPNKFFLLRGNHEIRRTQIKYGFYYECTTKYGEVIGQKVFHMINGVFDRLPLCAVIDESVYCAHGGIPCDETTLDDINRVTVVLDNPMSQSMIAWNIMWNDPISVEESHIVSQLLHDNVELEIFARTGFLKNINRSTGFYFTEKSVDRFLRANQLSHIIRAHEVPKNGYMFHFDGKCITIFSCSHYCGQDNESAVVHIVDGRIRIIRLDTMNNAPATEIIDN